MRTLVTGATGLLGAALVREASLRGPVTAVARHMVDADGEALDLRDFRRFRELVSRVEPDLVVNAAAIADHEKCARYPDAATELNALLPGRIASLCAETGVRFIHISTDAVFDGSPAGPFTELDEPNPVSVYAQTKLAGEQAVIRAHPQAVVARVNFHGWGGLNRPSLSEFFYRQLSHGAPVRGFVDVHFATLYNVHLAEVLMQLAASNIYGTWHVSSRDSMSKYDFAVRLADVFGLDSTLIARASVSDLKRPDLRTPGQLSLDSTAIASALRVAMPSILQGLARMKEDLSISSTHSGRY